MGFGRCAVGLLILFESHCSSGWFGTHYVIQSGLSSGSLLPQSPKCLAFGCEPPHMTFITLLVCSVWDRRSCNHKLLPFLPPDSSTVNNNMKQGLTVLTVSSPVAQPHYCAFTSPLLVCHLLITRPILGNRRLYPRLFPINEFICLFWCQNHI